MEPSKAQLKTLQRAFKNDKENQAYAVDLLFAYMEDKDDPGYQNWRLLIRKVLKSVTRIFEVTRTVSSEVIWGRARTDCNGGPCIPRETKDLKTFKSELDVMIKEPENYEIYKLIFEIINPNQIRAISTDTRKVFSSA